MTDAIGRQRRRDRGCRAGGAARGGCRCPPRPGLPRLCPQSQAARPLPRSLHGRRSEEHTSELQSPCNLVCRLLLEKKKMNRPQQHFSSLRRRVDDSPLILSSSFFFFNDTATTEIYTLSLHDALPICAVETVAVALEVPRGAVVDVLLARGFHVFALNPKQLDRFRDRFTVADRKSTRLNSSHLVISYAVFCLKKKK